jgi:hypothetical protein
MILRIEILDRSPAGAAVLGDVIEGLRANRDVTAQLARARDAIAGPATSRSALQLWRGW